VLLLAIAAVAGSTPPTRFAIAALLASVAIDFDHLPGYMGSHLLTGNLPRPYSHSLLPVAILALVALASNGRWRPVLLGAAFGLSAHLLRDLATGPGVSLLWPADGDPVTIPYAAYTGVLLIGAAATGLSVWLGSVSRRSDRRRLAALPLQSVGPPGGS